MKKNSSALCIFATALLAASCSMGGKSDAYTFTAPVSQELNGATAFMVNFDTGEKIDSVTIAGDTIRFSGTVDTPIMARLIVDGQRMGNFYLEPGNIVLENRICTGTPLNDRANEFNTKVQQFEDLYNATPQDSLGETARAEIESKFVAFRDSAFAANADNLIGYTLFLDMAYEMNYDQLHQTIDKYPGLKSYTRVQNLLTAAENKKKTSEGEKYADFTITTDSTSQSLSQFVGKGKPVLVDFWASWCGPCIRETKVLKELLNEYGPQGLEVVGVAVWDEPANTLAAIEKHQLPWPQIINAQNVSTDIYGISGIPCILLIGPDGTILSRDKQDQDLRNDVKAYFDGTLTAAADSIAQ